MHANDTWLPTGRHVSDGRVKVCVTSQRYVFVCRIASPAAGGRHKLGVVFNFKFKSISFANFI